MASYSEFVAASFAAYDRFLFIGAMGICVRCIAPCVSDKYADPAVVCMDSTGQFVVPVLSGHVGGANEWARQIAAILGHRRSSLPKATVTGCGPWTCWLPGSDGRPRARTRR